MQYSRQAEYYDKLYAFKDYEGEISTLLELAGPYGIKSKKTWLDVACGTGMHLKILSKMYDCEGLDICPELLAIAREKNPGLVLHKADMTDFRLDKKFDVISCFFGSIGHVLTEEKLRQTIRNFKQHLNEGGLMVIEPWHTPEQFRVGRTHLLTVEEENLKIARCSTSKTSGHLSVLDLHHLICTPEGTEHFVDHLELALFEEGVYLNALSEGNLTVKHEKIRSNGNGVYIAFQG